MKMATMTATTTYILPILRMKSALWAHKGVVYKNSDSSNAGKNFLISSLFCEVKLTLFFEFTKPLSRIIFCKMLIHGAQ